MDLQKGRVFHPDGGKEKRGETSRVTYLPTSEKKENKDEKDYLSHPKTRSKKGGGETVSLLTRKTTCYTSKRGKRETATTKS